MFILNKISDKVNKTTLLFIYSNVATIDNRLANRGSHPHTVCDIHLWLNFTKFTIFIICH